MVSRNGRPLPDDIAVCLGDRCLNLDAGAAGELAAAAVPSGSTATFTDVAPGTYPVTVHVGPTQVFAGSINVAAGTVSSLTVTINSAAPGTAGPGETDGDGSDGSDGSDEGDDSGGDGDASTVPPAITRLPSTGTGSTSHIGTYLILSIATGLVAAACLLFRQRRLQLLAGAVANRRNSGNCKR